MTYPSIAFHKNHKPYFWNKGEDDVGIKPIILIPRPWWRLQGQLFQCTRIVSVCVCGYVFVCLSECVYECVCVCLTVCVCVCVGCVCVHIRAGRGKNEYFFEIFAPIFYL